MLFLTTQPIWIAAVILLVPTTILAMLGPAFVRRHIGLDRLRTNNEVAGFKFATVGVIYAVLLAFAIVVVWERFNQADNDVAKEAGAAATVLRLTQGLDDAHADGDPRGDDRISQAGGRPRLAGHGQRPAEP